MTHFIELKDKEDVEAFMLGWMRQIVDTTLLVPKESKVVQSEDASNAAFPNISNLKISSVTV